MRLIWRDPWFNLRIGKFYAAGVGDFSVTCCLVFLGFVSICELGYIAWQFVCLIK